MNHISLPMGKHFTCHFNILWEMCYRKFGLFSKMIVQGEGYETANVVTHKTVQSVHLY